MRNPDASRGILHSLLLDRKGSARPIPAEDITDWTAADGVLWVHVDVNSEAAYEWLTAETSIDNVIVDALVVDETRPRSLPGENGTLIVLRGINLNPGQNPEDMVSIRIWLEANRIISSRRRKLLSVQDIIDSLIAGEGPESTGAFLVDLIARMADRIGDFVNQIEDELIAAEENPDELPIEERRRSLSTVRRQLAAVRRFLGPQRDALDRMYRHPAPWLADSDISQLREETERYTRYLEDLDLARERSVVLQEEFLAVVAQEQNSRMYVLSVVAAIFLPLTFITGLLGMNVGGLPGVDSPSGFYASVVVMVVACAGLVAFLRWKRWF